MNKLINAAEQIEKPYRKKYIEDLEFDPNFLDVHWPNKKNRILEEFSNKTGIPMSRFFQKQKRNLKINVPEPTTTYEPNKISMQTIDKKMLKNINKEMADKISKVKYTNK